MKIYETGCFENSFCSPSIPLSTGYAYEYYQLVRFIALVRFVILASQSYKQRIQVDY